MTLLPITQERRMMASTNRPGGALTPRGTAPRIEVVMHPQRIASVEAEYPEIRRLWRELHSVSYLASYFGVTEEQILEICLGTPGDVA